MNCKNQISRLSHLVQLCIQRFQTSEEMKKEIRNVIDKYQKQGKKLAQLTVPDGCVHLQFKENCK